MATPSTPQRSSTVLVEATPFVPETLPRYPANNAHNLLVGNTPLSRQLRHTPHTPHTPYAHQIPQTPQTSQSPQTHRSPPSPPSPPSPQSPQSPPSPPSPQSPQSPQSPPSPPSPPSPDFQSAQPTIEGQIFFDTTDNRLKDEFQLADEGNYSIPNIYTVSLQGLNPYYHVPENVLRTRSALGADNDECVLFYMMGEDIFQGPKNRKMVNIGLAKVFMYLNTSYSGFNYEELERHQYFLSLLRSKVDELQNSTGNTFLPLFIAKNTNITDAYNIFINPTYSVGNEPGTPDRPTRMAGDVTTILRTDSSQNNAQGSGMASGPPARRRNTGSFVEIPGLNFRALAANPGPAGSWDPAMETQPMETQPRASAGNPGNSVASRVPSPSLGGGSRRNKQIRKNKKTLKSSNKLKKINKKTKKVKARK
jgi:hypothetical protein